MRSSRACLRSHAYTLVCLALGLLLNACTPSAPPPPPEPAPPATEAREPSGPSLAVIREAQDYLDRGLAALQGDRLLTPESDNAFMWFGKALALRPDYKRAQDGIERIVERYLQLAAQALARDAYPTARTFIARAKRILPEHAGITRVERQLERMQSAERQRLNLDRQALDTRSAQLAAELAAFGRDARANGRLVRIFVPSDALGRWVYEQLSQSEGERRIRADIVTASPYRVEILIFTP